MQVENAGEEDNRKALKASVSLQGLESGSEALVPQFKRPRAKAKAKTKAKRGGGGGAGSSKAPAGPSGASDSGQMSSSQGSSRPSAPPTHSMSKRPKPEATAGGVPLKAVRKMGEWHGRERIADAGLAAQVAVHRSQRAVQSLLEPLQGGVHSFAIDGADAGLAAQVAVHRSQRAVQPLLEPLLEPLQGGVHTLAVGGGQAVQRMNEAVPHHAFNLYHSLHSLKNQSAASVLTDPYLKYEQGMGGARCVPQPSSHRSSPTQQLGSEPSNALSHRRLARRHTARLHAALRSAGVLPAAPPEAELVLLRDYEARAAVLQQIDGDPLASNLTKAEVHNRASRPSAVTTAQLACTSSAVAKVPLSAAKNAHDRSSWMSPQRTRAALSPNFIGRPQAYTHLCLSFEKPCRPRQYTALVDAQADLLERIKEELRRRQENGFEHDSILNGWDVTLVTMALLCGAAVVTLVRVPDTPYGR
jgi:hypothetical protein